MKTMHEDSKHGKKALGEIGYHMHGMGGHHESLKSFEDGHHKKHHKK